MKSNIRKLRNEKNISQTKLAEVLGKTQQTISHMERDRDRIPIESLIAMSEYFGCSTDYILGIESEEYSKRSHTATDKNPHNKAGSEGSAGENKKILYQLILTLLLDSLDDDAQNVIATLENNV